MSEPGEAARRAALQLLNDVTGDRRLLAEAEPERLVSLPPEDRARAARLAQETLRWMDRADRMLGPRLRQKPPLEIHNILRLALVEHFQMGTPAHAAVNGGVGCVPKGEHRKSLAGLVNAILRRLVGKQEDWDALPIPQLPKWLRKLLRDTYGKEVVFAIERAHAGGAPIDLTLKSNADIPEGLNGKTLPTGSFRILDRPQISALPGFAEGAWWVQDAAAALPARILDAKPGESVLDLCAAPGGKTMQLALAGAKVKALDISDKRLQRLRENLERTALHADVVVEDALTYQPEEKFDAILLDAPCSATGTIRRHPDLPYAKDGSELQSLASLQSRLFDHAWRLLAPGGRMVFCTCSLLPQEGEDQVEAALSRHSDMSADTEILNVPGIDPAWIGAHGLRTRPDFWPHLGGMDGFFIALLRKRAA